MNVARTAFDLPPAGDSDDDLHEDVSIIAHLAFARANRAGAAGDTRVQPLLREESLELDLSDPVQRRFGDYELLELIGEGGMGVVYRARQIGLDREVAVKLLAAGPWASVEFVERFRREAQNAARMQHPNIVAIYEVGDAEELQFFSMRLVHGGSLAGALKQEGRLAPLRAAQLLRTIAEAVDYAHRLGVLHLDLKPANVLLDEDGVPHVADFGLARRLDQGLAADNTEVSGTPSYMAPEQATAGRQNITPATDIWGLGAVLHELVTGLPPFVASTPQGTLKLVVDGAVRSPRRHVPDLPLDLEAIILKCLARNVADRYPSGRALADDLTRFIEGREVRARPLSGLQRTWRWARREPRLAATALVAFATLLIGLAATTQQWRRADANALESGQHAAESNERLWASRRETALRFAKDGKGFDALPLLVANIEEQERGGVVDEESVERRAAGIILTQGVTLIDRMIVPDASPMATALSPDGSLLAVALNDLSTRWYDTATLTERGRVDLSELPTSDGADHVPQLLRFVDNHRLCVTLEWYGYLPAPSENDSYLVDLDHGQVLMPPAEFADFRHATFSTDGRHAFLFNARQEMQFWQVEPWRALSPLVRQTVDYTLPSRLLGDGSVAVRAVSGLGDIERFDPRHPQKLQPIDTPPHESLTAWSASSDGRLVAVGDADGQVFLIDMRSKQVRQLPTPSGRDVSWLAFSEDDAWIAVARGDGAAFVFETATGFPLHSGQLQHDFPLRQVALSHRDRMLIASGFGETALWRLPERSLGGFPASLLIASPTHSPKAGPYWAGAAFSAGLLATADFNGEVRLWRLPLAAQLPARAAETAAGNIVFDGRHLPDVAWDKIRIISVGSDAATPWLQMPQLITFAELVGDGRTLVAVSGTELHVLDAATMKARRPSIELPATPIRFTIDATGRRAILTFGRNGDSGFREQIESFDLGADRAAPAKASASGPLRQLQLSGDGTLLVAVGFGSGATEIFDAVTLHRIGVYPNDPERPVLRAGLTSDRRAWLVTRDAVETESDIGDLLLWNPASDKIEEQRKLKGVFPVGLGTFGDIPVLAAKDRIVLDAGAAHARSSARLFQGESTTLFAFSHDHRLIAHAFGHDVYLYDAATMVPVSAPLHTDMGVVDVIMQLAFATDDRSLLCRTSAKKWFVWAIASDRRPAAELRYDADQLVAEGSGQRLLRGVEMQEKLRLRARDPGPWPQAEVRPRPPAARHIVGVPVPVRRVGLDPLMLDLTDFYTSAPGSSYNPFDSVMPNMDGMAFGEPRFEGIDYDLRGGVELRWGVGGRMGSHTVVALSAAARGIRVPPVPVAAFDLIMVAPLPIPVDDEKVYADLRVHYRDGSTALLPMRTNREIPGLNGRDRHIRSIGEEGQDPLPLIGELRPRMISNPRLPNPHPEKLIDTLDIETSRERWSAFVVLAITAEPVIPAAQPRSPAAKGDAARARRDPESRHTDRRRP